MRMDDQRESDNLEDRRGDGGGGGGGLRLGGGRMGLGTIAIALVASYFLGINPLTVINMLSGGGMPAMEQSAPAAHPVPANDPMAHFVSKVLASTEDTWREIFRANGKQYEDPKLVLFSGATPTACGTGQTAMGPFYCPGDHKVYIDLAFYQELKTRFHAPGEFAEAYVIAHLQTVLGIDDKARRQVAKDRRRENDISVRQELQADCLAGVWGKRTDTMKSVLEPGDLEAALTAASAIGDDRLQQQAQGRIVPESFTHGSSEQRVRWFRAGFESGDMNQCNTFKAAQL